MSKRGGHGVAELVLTSRYCEETALRALRYFANFAFNVSLFLERIPLRKARKVPQSSRRRVVSKEGRPYRLRLRTADYGLRTKMKIDHLGIAVKSISDSLAFYRDGLELDVAGTETV